MIAAVKEKEDPIGGSLPTGEHLYSARYLKQFSNPIFVPHMP
jgi:hypothetical protein